MTIGGGPQCSAPRHRLRRAASVPPSGLAQALERMGVVFRPHRRHAPTDINPRRRYRACRRHPSARAETQIPPGSAKPSRRAATFTPSPKDVAILDHDIADVDSDAGLDALVGRDLGVALRHAGLQLARTAQCIHHTAELDEEAVTCRLDEPTVMLGDLRIHQLGPDRLEVSESAALVHPYQPRIP